MTSAQTHTHDGRPRARGLQIFLTGEPGPLNAITDVAGIEVGAVTLIDGNGPLEVGRGPVRTGVTSWVNRVHPRLARQWLLPVCAETWDGYLNDINGAHVRPEHAEAALDAATSGPVAEGSVGGGTGMNCYEFKGGNGTASRVVRYGSHAFTVTAFVQANFGSRGELVVAGRHVGALLADDNPQDSGWFATDLGGQPPPGAGSVIAVIATDAPLLPGQWGPPGDDEFGRMTFIPLGRMDAFYAGVVQAVEEAVLNALVVNDDMVGRDGHRSPRLPIDRLSAILAGGREGSE